MFGALDDTLPVGDTAGILCNWPERASQIPPLPRTVLTVSHAQVGSSSAVQVHRAGEASESAQPPGARSPTAQPLQKLEPIDLPAHSENYVIPLS